MDHHPLIPWLDLAVPMALHDLEVRGGPTEADWQEAREFSGVLAERGDVLLFGGKVKRGQEGPGRLAARLARALAVLAHAPGGVTLFGRTWQAGKDSLKSRWSGPFSLLPPATRR